MEDPLQTVAKTAETHCRLCAEQKNYSEVLDLTSDVKTFAEYLKIIDYLKLDFLDFSHENKLPKTTCERCYDVFQEAYGFIKKFKDCQYILKAIYGTSVKTEPKQCSSKVEVADTEFSDDEIDSDSTKSDESNGTKLSHCRFCSEEKYSTDLINLTKNKDKYKEYVNMTGFFNINYLQIQIKLPKTACVSCEQSLKSAYKFFSKVKRNQTTLNTLYKIKMEVTSLSAVKIEETTEDMSTLTSVTLIPDIEPPPFSTVIDEGNIYSWRSYPWNCCHCHRIYNTAAELRSHSKEKHNTCYAFSCVDCSNEFNSFNEFVEHVREHREVLRLSCQFCDENFANMDQCSEHVNAHFIGIGKICELCGEMLPYPNTLVWHRKLYGQNMKEYGKKMHNRSWADYEWACQDCPTKFTDIATLRIHIQTTHDKCFAIKCMDCSKFTKTYKLFVDHVITHRPYLRNYCQYCNSHFEDIKELNQHIIKHITSQQRPCNICGQIFKDNLQLARHKKVFSTTSYKGVKQEGLTITTRKPRARRALTTEDLTCKVCSKLFQSMINLKKHVKIHEGARSRDFVCQVCGRAFLTNATLKEHYVTHNAVKSEVCQICKKEFHTKHKLKAHIVTHSDLRPFVCDECGNSFKTKRRLKCHLVSHSNIKPYKCMYCYKEFKFKENLKTHEYQHTGLRPYRCEMCERTFTNWANCNKHMIRKHGITLARTKITAQGRVAINRRTGEAKKIASDKNAKDWLNEMLKPEKPGKKVVKDL